MPTLSSDRNRRLTAAVSLYFDSVWRMLRRLGVPEADADDAAQHVFLILDRRLADVPCERERSFLLSTSVRIAANMRRKLKRSREDTGIDDDSVVSEASPERTLEHREMLQQLDQVLATFSEDLRAAFVLYEIEGFSLPEIALALGIPIGTATSRLRRAREAFESWLARRTEAGQS